MADYSDSMLGVRYQVKVSYLFIITIAGIPTYLCTKASRPKQSIAQVQINYLNMKKWQAGKVTWQPINVTVVDAYTPSGAQAVMAWMRSKHQPLSGRDGFASNYMRDATLHILGPNGSVQQSWKMINCWIQNVEFGELDMADENTPLQINLTLRYDKAILQF